MFKNMFLVAFLSLAFLQVSCSSNSSGDGDLDISEIKEIESTGEFSEDEFFSDEELVSEGDAEEGKLIEVPGDELAIEDAGGDLENTGDELDLEVLEDGEADLLADADLNVENEFDDLDESTGDTELAEDDGELSFDDLELDDETIADSGDSSGDDLLLEDDTDFGDFEDTASVDPGATEDSISIGEDEIDDLVASDIDTDEPSASDLLADEDVSVDNDVALEDSTTENITIENDELDLGFDDDTTSDTTQLAGSDEDFFENAEPAASSIVGEDISIDSPAYEDDATSVATNDTLSTDSTYTETGFADSGETGVVEEAPLTPAKTFIPVKKMKTVPYERNGILANTIYFVRDGDSLNSIANKIYGSGSAVDFTIVNPHLKPGALRVGQKVYYNSPRRPQDRSRLITFYEDMGSPAQYYQASSGENIRKISKDLLGHSRSWMEVWASNQDIVSKGMLDNNYSVRYWMGNDVPQPAVLASAKPTRNQVQPKPAPVAAKPKPVANNNTRSSLDAEIEMDQQMENKKAQQQQIANTTRNELEDFDEPAPIDEPDFDEPINDPVADNSFNEPSTSSNDGEIDFSKDDLADTTTAANTNNGFGNSGRDSGASSNSGNNNNVNPETPRKIAKRPSFPTSTRNGALSKSMIQTIAMGLGGLLLLLALLLIVRKKRKRAEAIQMDSFDFGGETTIESEQTKTQIDI